MNLRNFSLASTLLLCLKCFLVREGKGFKPLSLRERGRGEGNGTWTHNEFSDP